MTPDPTFCVLVGTYGDHPEYTFRCLDSVLSTPHRDLFKVFVGGSACSPSVSEALMRRYAGSLEGLMLTKRNINKSPMMASMIRWVDTTYFLWLDDDSWFSSPEWPLLMSRFILKEHPFSSGGKIYVFGFSKSSHFWPFMERRSWYTGRPPLNDKGEHPNIAFATGGLFVANTALVREARWPDHAMVKGHDDIMLGELARCSGMRLAPFTNEIDKIIRVSDGKRRGDPGAEDPSINPDTGFKDGRS